MSKPLKKQNVSITTSAAGNAGIGLGSTIVIISAHAAGYICSPFYLSSSNEWYINVLNPDGTKATSVSITAVVTYQDN